MNYPKLTTLLKTLCEEGFFIWVFPGSKGQELPTKGIVFGNGTEKSRMTHLRLFSLFLFFGMAISSCSKKTHPETSSNTTAKTETVAAPRTVKKKTAVPQVITVNDKYAKRSVDGRYYYDLQGKRYWRNNRDGKYYLFNKSMFDNPDFKSPGN
jgi:hypothetical protein